MKNYERGSNPSQYDDMSNSEMLARMEKGWPRNKETICGPGSNIANSSYSLSTIKEVIKNYSIKTMSDAGAGDLHWITQEPLGVSFQGYDLVPRHKDVSKFDITKEILPKTDLILCRHVLNHLSIKLSKEALSNFSESGSKYLLVTMNSNQKGYWDDFGLKPINHGWKYIQSYQDYHTWNLVLYENIN
jgi:hypothetical protein